MKHDRRNDDLPKSGAGHYLRSLLSRPPILTPSQTYAYLPSKESSPSPRFHPSTIVSTSGLGNGRCPGFHGRGQSCAPGGALPLRLWDERVPAKIPILPALRCTRHLFSPSLGSDSPLPQRNGQGAGCAVPSAHLQARGVGLPQPRAHSGARCAEHSKGGHRG